MKKVLTIAGSDSGGGAGVQADIKTFTAFGVYATSVITSVTAQNTMGVEGIFDLPAEFVELQLDAILRDIGTDAVKTGMLSNTPVVEMLAERLRDKELKKSVVDPVMISKSKHFLLQPTAREVLKTKLVPRTYVITPNIPEAQLISETEINDEEGMKKAAQIIYKMGARNVVIKGGHLKGKAIDIFFDGKNYFRYEFERLPGKHTHGTGCTFAASIAAGLALGMDLDKAVIKAKEFVTRAIAHGFAIGQGIGPANHLFEKVWAEEVVKRRKELVEALDKLKRAKIGYLIPEVRSNFVVALGNAVGPGDVLGFPGRILPMNENIMTIAPPIPGGSNHMAKVVLTAMRGSRSIKSGINLAYSGELISAFESRGYQVAEFDRKREPKKVRDTEGASLEWGTSLVIKRLGVVPDVIFDKGAIGKEAMVRVLGKNPKDVARKVVGVWNLIKESFPG